MGILAREYCTYCFPPQWRNPTSRREQQRRLPRNALLRSLVSFPIHNNNNNNNSNKKQQQAKTKTTTTTTTTTMGGGSRPKGPFGVDPLHFAIFLFCGLVLFVFYLLLPRAVRKQYFGAYPKRYAWSTRSKTGGASTAGGGSTRRSGSRSYAMSTAEGSYAASSSLGSLNTGHRLAGMGGVAVGVGGVAQQQQPQRRFDEEQVEFGGQQQQKMMDMPNDEIVISAAMQQLRDPGVLIVAHGSRGKPKTVRLQLTETAITWRTETRKKHAGKDAKPKMGKLHSVPLSHIMYVDVGKQTTALRRVENAAVAEALCFSLLTKEGSLDLEANSPRERDALVSCFSMVLDEVHAQNWRDIYRGPSSDMPSSFDELDPQDGGGAGVGVGGHPETNRV